MEMNKLAIFSIAIFALSVIVLMTIAIVGQYSYVLRQTTTTDNVQVTLLEGTGVAVGAAGVYPYLQTANPCVNNTAAATVIPQTLLTVIEGDENGGYLTLTAGTTLWNNTQVNCTITNLADTSSQGTADKFLTGVGYFGTFVGVIVLAIVGMFIVGLYRKKY